MTLPSQLFRRQLRLQPRRSQPSTPNNNNFARGHRPPSPSSPQWHHHNNLRGIVTSSTPPSPDVFIERPEIIVLAESSLYDHSWKDASATFYPSMGLHFASIDIMKSMNNSNSHGISDDGDVSASSSLKSLERTMAEDLSRIGASTDPLADLFIPGHAPTTTSTSAHAVLIARGPLQCLTAQYFLESLPLAGLVLVDPLLLPEDGRTGIKKMKAMEEGAGRWETSLSDLITMLDENMPGQYSTTKTGQEPSSLELELSLLRSLANNDDNKNRAKYNARPLSLEAGAIPTLVCHSGGDHAHGDYYRVCAERTAAFHTCGGKGDYFDQVSVVKVPKKGNGETGAAMDDLDRLSKTIYEWYDEVVA